LKVEPFLASVTKKSATHGTPKPCGGWAPGVVVSVGRLTSGPWVQFPVERGRGGWKGGIPKGVVQRGDRRRVWGARALPPSPPLGASRTGVGRQTGKNG